jgi:glycosyltransferase involved in cell wall biosynthesis
LIFQNIHSKVEKNARKIVKRHRAARRHANITAMDKKNIFIIIPAYNEATVIRETLKPLVAGGYRIVVVDDGSTDGTCAAIRSLPVTVIEHSINLGQGAALQTGMAYALSRGAEILVHFDADGQHDHHDIERLIQPILEGRADITLGSRFLDKKHTREIPPLKRILLRLATLFTMLVSGIRLTDTHNGFRAFSRKAAQQIEIRENNMAHASEILHKIARAKLSYTEIPVRVFYTQYSQGKGQSIFNSINILFDFIIGRFLK